MHVSQRIKPTQQVWILPPPWGLARLRRWIDLFERLSLGLQIGSRVVIGRVESRVPKPVADHRYVDTGGNELNTDAVTPSVRCDAFCRERWHVLGSRLDVLLELEANPCCAKRLTVSINKNGFVIRARLSPQ
jgi:hypothetical protein